MCEPTLHDEPSGGADGGAQAVGGVASELASVVVGRLIGVGLQRPRAVVQDLGEQQAVLHPTVPVRGRDIKAQPITAAHRELCLGYSTPGGAIDVAVALFKCSVGRWN